MGQVSVIPFADHWADDWDQLIDRSINGTFMHSRRFLGYHGNRFTDASVLLRKGDRTVGVIPAAEDPHDKNRVISHPGLTYGGLVRVRRLSGEDVVTALDLAGQHYADRGYRELRYKATPPVFHRFPAADDVYALQRHGARRYRCDLNSVIDLTDPDDRRNENRRRGYKKATAAGVSISTDSAYLEEYWEVLSQRLAERHGVRPVHTISEIRVIADLFPHHVRLVAGLLDGRVAAGVLLFSLGPTMHIQYSASTAAGRAVAALDPVTWHAIECARAAGARWFSFGISTENEGRTLNSSLYQFKESFGASGIVHEHYAMPLA